MAATPQNGAPVDPSPRVSILIPTYNGARYLAEAIESVLNQTCRDFELLVIDNASTDGTPEIIARYDDPRLRKIRNENNLGLIGSVDKGRTLARGRLLVDIGSDDIWEPDLLECALRFWDSHPGLSFMHASAILIDSAGTPCGGINAAWREVTPGREAFVEVYKRGFCFSGMFMRKDLLDKFGTLDRSWDDMLDLWWFLKLSLNGDVGYMNRALLRYRLHDNSLSSALYVRGQGFRNHLALAASAFDWPSARSAGLTEADRKLALKYIALDSMNQLHAVRDQGTKQEFLQAWSGLLTTVPILIFYPRTWLRLGLGLLPRALIKQLRRWRRRRAGARISLKPLQTSRKPADLSEDGSGV